MELFDKYDLANINKQVELLGNEVVVLASKLAKEKYAKLAFSLIDYTSLATEDNERKISAWLNDLQSVFKKHKDIPKVAGICVYPVFVATVKKTLEYPEIKVVSVSSGFPASQTFEEVKILETRKAIEEGAQEIDIVMSVGRFLDGDFLYVRHEIETIKKICGNIPLKVILETGALPNIDSIAKASILALQGGADFIKTSTGKQNPAASIPAIATMSLIIKKHFELTNQKKSLKAAGGIVTTDQALQYIAIVKHVLGEEYIDSKWFRLGASRLANNLLHDIMPGWDNDSKQNSSY